MNDFPSYEEFEAWLTRLGMFHMELGLSRIKNTLERLDIAKPSFPIIQVLGTNGKGSTSSFISSLATHHGLKCGLFQSPHFVYIEERIKIDNQFVSRDLILEQANILKASLAEDLTYFEFLTALSILIFVENNVDLAVFEAGLGGTNDATSAILADLHCYTPIAMDHANVIGPGLDEIARDKAGAIKKNSIVLSTPQSPPVNRILFKKCAEMNSRYQIIPPQQKIYPSRLSGETQKINISLALGAWREFAKLYKITPVEKQEKEAIENAFLPGRFQFIPKNDKVPPLLLDGAHNPHATRALVQNMGDKRPKAIIFSALVDKDWKTTLEILDKFTGPIPMFIPDLNNSRACNPFEIAKIREKRHPNSTLIFYNADSFIKALNEASKIAYHNHDFLLVTGSLYLLSEFFKLFPQYLEGKKYPK